MSVNKHRMLYVLLGVICNRVAVRHLLVTHNVSETVKEHHYGLLRGKSENALSQIGCSLGHDGGKGHGASSSFHVFGETLFEISHRNAGRRLLHKLHQFLVFIVKIVIFVGCDISTFVNVSRQQLGIFVIVKAQCRQPRSGTAFYHKIVIAESGHVSACFVLPYILHIPIYRFLSLRRIDVCDVSDKEKQKRGCHENSHKERKK